MLYNQHKNKEKVYWIVFDKTPGVFPPYISSASLGPGRGNKGNNKLVLQLARNGCSNIGVLITAGNLKVTEISSGQAVASVNYFII